MKAETKRDINDKVTVVLLPGEKAELKERDIKAKTRGLSNYFRKLAKLPLRPRQGPIGPTGPRKKPQP